MKIFKKNTLPVYVNLILLMAVLSGCNEISRGLQRKKFEFLYKMNNYASLSREFTGSISFYGDIESYDSRMDKLYEDVSKMETIEGYKASGILKDNFLSLIQENIRAINIVRQRHLPAKENIRNEYEVLLMNDRVNNFVQELNDEISKVGREK